MSTVANWPAPVRDHLASYGSAVTVELLGGMSGARVWRVRFPGSTVIVKASASAKELDFYTTVAGPLGELGISTPGLKWSGREADGCWLVLEDVPEALPKMPAASWRADPRVLETLCGLHGAPSELGAGLPDLFEPSWTDEMSAAALTHFAPVVAASLFLRLEPLQREVQRLFEPQCLISGDPNPANWGVRQDGTVVLFDWERFGLGSPALDLAIIVSGLGNKETYRRLALDYDDTWRHTVGPPSWAHRELAHDIAIAKAWTVIELMAEHVDGTATVDGELIDWLIGAVPPWLAGIAGDSLSQIS